VLVQVRIGAAVKGHLGTGAQARIERAQADFVTAERLVGQIDERDVARPQEGDGNGRQG
jgi:hypothetical protein